ncbi:OmpA family protein [Paraflavitalea sp. CAU 1676]|uniref:OmpA family protein n=1 Tax=Paraflavitalea sp. CAU 1676 TaxID=3032598 RepID=UPI0023D9D9EB|nr:OmpA family protein [Paraflavitalea sp. CAU 1676]MDF2192494.1 OmpA family protein [Paraflavitalea sp. CAU 1676]
MRFALLISSSLLALSTRAQHLIANGSFEDENLCTEYNHNCAPEAWIANSFYANYYYHSPGKAAEGTHFVGLASGNRLQQGTHNFVRTRLLCGLQPGHRYMLQFYVRSRHDILDSVGAWFSQTDFLLEKRSFKLLQPQLWATQALDTLYEDPREWQKVRLLYTATGNEQYLTIGSFNRKEYIFRGAPDLNNDYYFFLDAVSLQPVDPAEQLCAQADSVKAEVYLENERHEYLRKLVYMRTKTPPVSRPLPKTITRIPPPKQHIDTLIIPDIYFATARYQLTSKSYGLLDSFAHKLNTRRIDSLVVGGHTDTIGTLAYNEALSLNRANAVKEYLLGKLNDKQAPVVARGYAYRYPVASNKKPAGRQQNRRVEIYVYRKEE